MEHMTCARRVELLQQIMMPANWGQFRAMADKLAALDQSKIVIFRGDGNLDTDGGAALP